MCEKIHRQYIFRTVLKECTKVLLVWERSGFSKGLLKPYNNFFEMGDEGRTRSFSCESLCDFSYLLMCPIFFQMYKKIYMQ